MKRMIIAIDGPSASGKGTLARSLANALSYEYLDTGALYRAVGKQVLDAGHDPEDEAKAAETARLFAQNFKGEWLADPALRNDTVARAASVVAKNPAVRAHLLQFQKDFAAQKGVILDGRDIGTVIAPEAEVKFFVTASVEERTKRRFEELTAKGQSVTYDAVLADMKERDARDSGRDTAPLKSADDAILLDTSAMGAKEVMDYALSIIRTRQS
jgi:CMP/dCMP kinase